MQGTDVRVPKAEVHMQAMNSGGSGTCMWHRRLSGKRSEAGLLGIQSKVGTSDTRLDSDFCSGTTWKARIQVEHPHAVGATFKDYVGKR